MRQQHATQYPDLEQQSLIFNKYWIQTKRAKVEQGGGLYQKSPTLDFLCPSNQKER